MSNGNSMKICPLGNTQEMFKPQICSYPIKHLCGNFSYSKAKLANKSGECNTERISAQHWNYVILLSFV